jgi:hypothetical protein
VKLIVSTVAGALAVIGAVAPSTKFKNCDALLQKYPRGVARDAASVGTTGAVVNLKIYAANASRLDRDKDGVACER